jgi:hypothetical protein
MGVCVVSKVQLSDKQLEAVQELFAEYDEGLSKAMVGMNILKALFIANDTESIGGVNGLEIEYNLNMILEQIQPTYVLIGEIGTGSGWYLNKKLEEIEVKEAKEKLQKEENKNEKN